MNRSNSRRSDRGDVAALAAAVITIVISLFGPGPYDVAGALVGLTLAFLIAGYVWSNRRTLAQSLAVASIIGGIAIPIVGFALEVAFSKNRSLIFVCGNPVACGGNGGDAGPSAVEEFYVIGAWSVVGLIAFLIDRRQQESSR